MQKVDLQDNESGTENQWVRPHSGYTDSVPKPPDEERPRSATIRNRYVRKKHITLNLLYLEKNTVHT